MKRLNEFEHSLKKWEKTRGFIGHGDRWLSFFSEVFDRPFTLHIEDQELSNRKIDKFGRIYVGKKVWDRFQVGDILRCVKDAQGNYYIQRKKLTAVS